jgi:hypothetical protein
MQTIQHARLQAECHWSARFKYCLARFRHIHVENGLAADLLQDGFLADGSDQPVDT